MDLSFEGHRIAVTGGAGFLGRNVCADLERNEMGREQIAVPRRAEFDLTQREAVSQMYVQLRPDIVIHLAAEVGGIGANRASPGRFFYANLAMGMHLIEQARDAGLKKIVMVGTVCSYPKHTPVPFREDDLWNGYPEGTNAPYGIAKKALLVMLQAYRQQYGLNGVYLIPVNLYGPGDNFDLETSHVIPAMIRKFVDARVSGAAEVTLWGTGSASREFLYVEDCARAIVMATQRYDGAEPVNIGTGREITIRDLAEKIRGIVGYRGRIIWDSTKPDGQPRRCLDTSRAKAAFGFEATTGFDEGLQRTVDWYCNERGIKL
ncbi:MAG: GDP-L-fucose synthase [Planctomycetia bacterium]|nr:GDP-L-fucose synthase [Planctomycetia bacterium]MCC7314818.1 GDP-L-fucose synthase [Planctomycetota bacterium]OQY98396.1 MAG: GDP-fucose synthetase [Planctomycetes bacterium UTPLA1]